MRQFAFVAAFAVFGFAGMYACGGDDSSSSDSDAGTSQQDSGTAEQDTGSGESNGTKCTTFEDMTAAADVKITFPEDANPAQFSPNCIKIKKGQSVTWEGSFTNHPLVKAGGNSNTPITPVTSGTTKTFTFNGIGTFGFECNYHPEVMFGGVQVVP